MKRSSLLLLPLLWTGIAHGAPLPLPQGAQWLVAAPTAGRFAHEAGTLLEQAGRQSSAVSPRAVGLSLEKSFAFPLVDEQRLTAAGVDSSQPWLLFGRNDATYLSLGVRDAAMAKALIEDWATKRQLKREEEKSTDPMGTVVTFSRSAGARPVTGYFIARQRVVLLVTPGERSAGLRDAWNACEQAAPVVPPVSGTLLSWLGRGGPVQEGWLAFSARPDGIDLTGGARRVESGWLLREPGRTSWLQALTDPSEGLPGDPPARLRLSAGPKAAAALAESIAGNAGVSEAMEKWIRSLSSLGPGPIEAIAQTVDVSTLQAGSSGDLRSDLLLVTKPQVRIVDRPAAAVAKRVDAAASALCKPRKLGDTVSSQCPDTPLTVSRTNGTLSVTWGRTANTFEAATPARAGSGLACSAGMAVASARLDLAAVFRGTKSLGFLDALSNDALAGLYAFVTQYGALMKASKPATALVCQDRDGRVSVVGQWRFASR